MYMRLWWKDARQFWTIWVFVALAAAAGQWAALHYYGADVRQGPLLAMALGWAAFYAVAAGAAAFAGERETGTLRLLDILPVSRFVVWIGKFSFALITTLAMAALLLIIAAMSTDRWGTSLFGRESPPLTPWLAACYGLVVLLALSWGLFWSTILSNALTAALAAVGSTAISMIVMIANLDERYQNPIYYHAYIYAHAVTIFEIVVILANLVASNVLFTRDARRRQLPFQFQSPIVMAPIDYERPGLVQLQSPAPRAGVAQATTSDQSPRRSRLAEARALAWETVREGGTTWCLLAVIGLAVPLPFYFGLGYFSPELLLPLDMIVALVAGINVFGMENRGRTQRFLTHHGARPGLVWLVKLAVWGVGLMAIWGPHAIVVQRADLVRMPVPSPMILSVSVLMLSLLFSIALLCGMTIARGLTAAVIAAVMTLALAFPQSALVSAFLLPVQGFLLIPVALLFVSWAWSGDWLLERPAPGRWLRLGLMLTGTFAVLLGIFTGYRAWSVPDVGPIAPPRAWIASDSAPVPADRNAAELYVKANGALKSPHSDLKLNGEALDLVRRAAALPDCRFPASKESTPTSPDLLGTGLMRTLDLLIIQSARDRLTHDDLDGAWNDLITVFRMVRHESDGAPIAPAMNALITEREALDLAMEWAVASSQKPEKLRSALAAIRDLPKMTPADEVLRAEANLTEKTFDLPARKLEQQLQSVGGPRLERTDEFWRAAWLDWLTTPWERTRARRVNRLLATAAIQKATLEPWQRPGIPPRSQEADLRYELASTPLAKLLLANTNPYLDTNDWNEVGRRALVQVLALRAWQLRHNGQFPDSLDKLVPEELPSLPIDPYSGRTFGYVRSGGQPHIPLGQVLSSVGTGKKVQTTGYWLLYSDERETHDDDDAALSTTGTVRGTQPFDIVFPIPPVQRDGGVDKKR